MLPEAPPKKALTFCSDVFHFREHKKKGFADTVIKERQNRRSGTIEEKVSMRMS
jgi:hypothetical protein